MKTYKVTTALTESGLETALNQLTAEGWTEEKTMVVTPPSRDPYFVTVFSQEIRSEAKAEVVRLDEIKSLVANSVN